MGTGSYTIFFLQAFAQDLRLKPASKYLDISLFGIEMLDLYKDFNYALFFPHANRWVVFLLWWSLTMPITLLFILLGSWEATFIFFLGF